MKDLKLILASTSPYRKELLERLGIPFVTEKPLFDEESHKSSTPDARPIEVCRELAMGKAASLKDLYPDAWVIGSDQALDLDGKMLGKKPDFESALAQLLKLNGKAHHLITSVCLYKFNERPIEFQNISTITLKNNSKELLERYLQLDAPYDCAGCYKMESHGMALVQDIQCSDSTSIMGLPLIELGRKLEKLGFDLLQNS